YSNIGASSVFVNYDGVNKHHTTIGSHVRTGSDTMFIAPVTVGDGAYSGAGTVIKEDVPAGARAVSVASSATSRAGWPSARRAPRRRRPRSAPLTRPLPRSPGAKPRSRGSSPSPRWFFKHGAIIISSCKAGHCGERVASSKILRKDRRAATYRRNKKTNPREG